MNFVEKKSIIASIVLYQHTAEDVQPTINSLLANDLVELIVLIDNAGCEWANRLNNQRITYIKSENNNGFGHGHNQAIDKYINQCNYFIICNPDIEFSADTIEILYTFARTGNHRFIAPKIIYPDGKDQHVCRLLPTPIHMFLRRFLPFFSKHFNKKYELHEADYSQIFSVPAISGCFMFIESELLNKLQGFDPRYFMYFEDVDLCRRALPYATPMFCADATVTHAFAKGSYKNFTLMCHHVRSAIHYFNKWGWFFDIERRKINQKCMDRLPRLAKYHTEK